MINLIRKIRYRRELEEIEYHRNMVAEYRGKKSDLIVDLGWFEIKTQLTVVTRLSGTIIT